MIRAAGPVPWFGRAGRGSRSLLAEVTVVALAWMASGACSPRAGCGQSRATVEVDAPCADRLPSLVEVRDGQGALLLAARARTGSEGDATLCDPSGRALGTLLRQGGGLAIRDLGGAIGSRLEVPGPDAGADEEPRLRFAGHTARLHESGTLLRILDESGVPLGQIEKQPGRAVAFDAAGRGLATAERVEKQDDARLAVRAPDGSTHRILLGLHGARAAAVFALPGLPLPEALLVACFLDDK